MTDNTCKNCRFWRRDTIIDINFGVCSRSIFLESNDDRLSTKAVKLWSDKRIDVDTGEDFGCIHFEKRTK